MSLLDADIKVPARIVGLMASFFMADEFCTGFLPSYLGNPHVN
jgi:hypothetical protein